VDEFDRQRYRDEVISLAERLAGADAENAVWDVYAGTEKLIAILKFRLDYETPGVFTRLPDASDPAKLLKDAGELLSKASDEIARGRLVLSIGTLRKARNNLRSYLTDRRKSATRRERKARGEPSKRQGVATRT
jgi:hypothetical protein